VAAAREAAARTGRREKDGLVAQVVEGAAAMVNVARAHADALAPGLAAVGWEFRMMLCGMTRHRCRALPASARLAVDSEFTDERCPRWCRC